MKIRYDADAMWLVRDDGWQFKLDGIYGVEYKQGRDSWGFGICEPQRLDEHLVVTIPEIRSVEHLDALSKTLRALREEMPAHFSLVIETKQ